MITEDALAGTLTPPITRFTCPPDVMGEWVFRVSSRRSGLWGVYTPGEPGRYVKWSAGLVGLVTGPLVTLTSIVPADPAGLVVVMLLSSTTTKPPVTGLAPNSTCSCAVLQKPEPVIVTPVPPATPPKFGWTPVTE